MSLCATQTARWSESPGDLKRFNVNEERALAALVFDQDMLNDLLLSTSVGLSVAPLAMRGSNLSSTAMVSAGRSAAPCRAIGAYACFSCVAYLRNEQACMQTTVSAFAAVQAQRPSQNSETANGLGVEAAP